MSGTSSAGIDSWISTFCSLMGHEYFAEVSEDFIEDDFNLTGLQAQVPMYKEALEMILDVEPSETGSELSEEEEEDEEQDEEEDEGLLGEELDQPAEAVVAAANGGKKRGRSSSDTSVIESSAELLYGLIHARYITSRPGIQQMMEKYEMAHFGYCPRVYCHGTKVLPVGRTDTPGQETVKLFCPSCLDIYTPPNSRFQAVDGAFFGTTFPGLFLMTFPDLDIAPAKKRSRDNGVANERDETESVLSPNEAAAQQQQNLGKASRSSSLTLPSAPPIPGVNTQPPRDERRAAEAAALAALPPQPASMNGVATQNLAPGLGRGKIYEPKIYGFRVSERAKGGPRMRWLRSKPIDINELDEARIYHEKYGGNVDGDPDEEADEEGGDEEDEEAAEEQEHDGDQIMHSPDKAAAPTKRKSKASRSSRGGATVAAGGG
ncbi:casein kinase 2 regulatory subunit [Exophiala xenobiotica]|uniref:Casein kinase II subunit beta n=1 Tax=Lithohypha guttulata TaxID=1690604 RepID=A0ABR0K7M8_9EURO|nr:casein kinase 2 regulatory subunit [Lithohypha guttulata]KAK5315839.1 casein kinase 2 regulatory subunit [Exophiala xenobiotica]